MTSTIEKLKNITTGTNHHDAAEKRHPPLLDGGRDAARLFRQARRRPASHWRFVPVREDLATPASWSPRSRRARPSRPCRPIASWSPTPMGVTGAGIFGDILCMRMVKRGVTALITDGVMRDKHGVRRYRPAGVVRRRAAPASSTS